MPHKQRPGRQLYRRNRKRILAHATHCTWCGVGISVHLPVGHPQKATADHVVPLSRGGTDDESNLVPACWLCNCKRGNAPPSALLPQTERSQDW